ncbi:hypothetical protein GF324_03670 [bacterium]|nr:hypothetical protein [bacterium]
MKDAYDDTDPVNEMYFLKLHLHAADLKATAAFYNDVLDLPILYHTDSNLSLQAGATTLYFSRAHEGTKPHYHFAFRIPEERFQDLRLHLEENIELLPNLEREQSHVHDHPDLEQARSLYFKDPAGNLVEAIMRPLTGTKAATPFGSGWVESINEIGMPASDVEGVAQLLKKNIKLPFYHRMSDHVIAYGDSHAMLLVVERGWQWTPKSYEGAQVYPVEVTIADAPKKTVFSVPGYPYTIKTERGR